MRVRIIGFGSRNGSREWIGELRGKTANNISIIRDDAGRDWAIPNQQVFNIAPLKIGDKVRSTLGYGDSRFVIIAKEIDKETGEELCLCRSVYSDDTWKGRKRYAYSDGELERLK